MDQSAIQAAIQTTLLTLADFDSDDVVINDNDVLDRPIDDAPYAIIYNVRTAEVSRAMGNREESSFGFPVYLVFPFTTAKETRDGLRDLEDSFVTAFTGSAWSANGLKNHNVIAVHYEETLDIYEPGIDPRTAEPVYLVRPLLLEMEIY